VEISEVFCDIVTLTPMPRAFSGGKHQQGAVELADEKAVSSTFTASAQSR